MTGQPEHLAEDHGKSQWDARAQAHGSSPRAVLLKGLPASVNHTIDMWHRDVLRKALADVQHGSSPILDLGCGYGRLASEAYAMGIGPVVGVDYAPSFCRLFPQEFGGAVCASLKALPFATDAFSNAYVVTSLMYLQTKDAHNALLSLEKCLEPGARVLILEPGAEFHRIVRLALNSKRTETLARPGFTMQEFSRDIAPRYWRLIASGSNLWATILLPALIAFARFHGIYRWIESFCLRMDRPAAHADAIVGRYALHRWAVYEVPAVGPDRERNSQM